MGFNPSTVNLTYKKYRTKPSQIVAFSPQHTPKSNISISHSANWLQIVKTDINEYTFKVKEGSYADNLPVGSSSVRVKFNYKRTILGIGKNHDEYITVNINVQDSIALKLSASFMGFEYTIGQNVPKKRFMTVTAEDSWSLVADAPWLGFSRTQGTGTVSLEVIVDVTGLPSGYYNGLILVDDGRTQKTVRVGLNVLGENTAEDFLLIQPDNLELLESYGQTSSASKKLVVETSEIATLSADVPWLSFSQTTVPVGELSIRVATVNSHILDFGSHLGKITVESGYSTRVVNVRLTVNESVVEGVESNTLYFADDRKNIGFSNTVDNSELVLEFDTQTENNTITYSKTVTFFRGVAKSILGQEAKNLISGFNQWNALVSSVLVPLAPLKMNITAYDKQVSSTQRSFRALLSNVEVLTGKTPTVANWLSNIPTAITTVKDAVVVFSFMATESPEDIVISGAVDTTLAAASLDGNIFTCIVNLSEFTLTTGDSIGISCGGFSVSVNILPTEPEHTKVAWLNEWGCPEIFTCRGTLEIENETDQKTATYARDGQEVIEVIDVDNPTVYSVRTGFLYSREEVKWLQTILKSRKIWIEVDGFFVPVIRAFKKLPFYETRNYLDAYELKFESAVV